MEFLKHSMSIKRVKSNNSLFKNNLKNYLENSTPKELAFDWIIPILFSFIVFIFVYYISSHPRNILQVIREINNLALIIVPILAGFNTASLAIIASASSFIKSKDDKSSSENDFKEDITYPSVKQSIFKKLYNLIVNNKTGNDLHTLVSFYAYAIIFQLVLLIIGIVISALITLIDISVFQIMPLPDYLLIVILCLLGFLWLLLLFHSIFISIRNVDLIMHYIIQRK